MKKKPLLMLSLFAILALTGCSASDTTIIPSPSGNTSSGGTITEIVVDETPTTPEVEENTSDFSISTEDGEYTNTGSVYTISKAGTYVLNGSLEGQIVIDAGDEDEVVLELNGFTITNSTDSPIKAINADKLEISAKKGTSNAVYDKRSQKTIDSTELGEGAINAKCDLKLKGTGVLVVEGNYNNGIHTTKDLTIQKETLYVTAVNNAIKGKDSINMLSGTVTAVSKSGNGLKTDNTDVSSSGKQRGTITISGGTLTVDSLYDAIDAAYNLVINEENDENLSTEITIKTGKYSSNSSKYSSSTSAKGLKGDNEITISAGTVTIKASDDAIHANYGDALENGSKGQGTINISGGTIGIASGDDGIHADNTLNITGGDISITNASEGIESNHIKISGGNTYVYGTDDGVNASKKINQTPTIEISGGFLDVQVSSGDTDGIDTNGTYTQTGGLVISRGSPNTASNMSTGLDADGTATISGGTFIAFNGVESTPKTGSGVLYAYYGSASQGGPGGGGPGGFPGRGSTSGTTFTAGTYTLSGGNMTKTFYNQYTYSTFLVYSNEMSTGTSYTLKNGSSTVLSWTQNSSSQQIS